MTFDCYEFKIAGAYASALINGDYSGIDDGPALDAWVKAQNLPARGHWDGFSEEDALGFCRDDVTGLYADCYRVRWMFPA